MVTRRPATFLVSSSTETAGHPFTWLSSGYHRAAPEVHARHYCRQAWHKNICLDPPFSGSYLDTQLESSEVKLLKKVHSCVLRGNNTSFSVGLFFLASFKRIIRDGHKPSSNLFLDGKKAQPYGDWWTNCSTLAIIPLNLPQHWL